MEAHQTRNEEGFLYKRALLRIQRAAKKEEVISRNLFLGKGLYYSPPRTQRLRTPRQWP